LPDDFVREVALAGDRAHARGRVEAALAAGADSVHVFPLGQRRMETVEAFAACFGDVVGVRA
jgi:5,10-methylenetetrahydromethanopterin reductase